MGSKLAKPKHKTLLWWVGLWATIWWAATGIYIVWVVWIAKDYYIQKSFENVFYWQDWRYAFDQTNKNDHYLYWLLIALLVGWLLIGLFWLKALRQRRISLKTGLKDLLFTIR